MWRLFKKDCIVKECIKENDACFARTILTEMGGNYESENQ